MEDAFSQLTNLEGYAVRKLKLEDIEALQKLFEKCSDYAWIVEGEGVSPNAAQDVFTSLPPGRSLNDKYLYGVIDRQGEMVGMLEGMRNYPDDKTWWVGLLLLAPKVRGCAIGRKLISGFFAHVHAEGGENIMLGVVEENNRAYHFWQQMGFELVRKTEPRPFGKKMQSVLVMRCEVTGEVSSAGG
jgi:ribosomal protein S18 acetylase RimI-like enzyme